MARTGITVRPLTDGTDKLPAGPGAYMLMLDIPRSVPLRITTLPRIHLPPGRYAYVGSAKGPGGIRARVRRHLRTPKKAHWHVDQLTAAGAVVEVTAHAEAHECDIVDRLLRRKGTITPVAGFGSTDCKRCKAHLIAFS
jgi:Uri superfamily endonuclease